MLYILRHGKTDWNLEYRLQGQTDIPLNEEGIRSARQAGEQYRDLPLDVCYCSPLQRAQDTARLFLAGRDVPIITDDRLKEMSFGSYEGTARVYSHPELPVYALFKDPVNYRAQNGAESFEQLYARTGEFLNQVARPAVAAGKNVLIVGHGALLSCIYNQYHDVPLERFWDAIITNCQLLRLE